MKLYPFCMGRFVYGGFFARTSPFLSLKITDSAPFLFCHLNQLKDENKGFFPPTRCLVYSTRRGHSSRTKKDPCPHPLKTDFKNDDKKGRKFRDPKKTKEKRK